LQIDTLKARIPSPSRPLAKLATCLNTVSTPQVNMLKQLCSVGGSFGSLKLIPLLVSLYDWLYETQSYAISFEDSMTKQIGTVFDTAP
jgi:hypothetical protein